MNIRAQIGFTLYELLVTLLVGGVLLGIGVPNFLAFQRNNAMVAATNNLVSGLYLARAEAVKRQVPVTLCGSANPLAAAPACGGGGNGGFIVFVDENGNVDANGSPVLTDASDGNAAVDAGETVLMQRAAPGGTMNVLGDGGQYVSYAPNGFPVPQALGQALGRTNAVLYCDERGIVDVGGGRSAARAVTISPTGRAQTLTSVADVTNEAALRGLACP
jgi:type IV fimbrial biogenesis protein FimT